MGRPTMLYKIYCMVNAQQANLSECEGRKNFLNDPIFLLKSISLIWDSRVMLNFSMVAQSPYYLVVYFSILIHYHMIVLYTILYYTILFYTILYYTVLYCTILYCTMYYIVVTLLISYFIPSLPGTDGRSHTASNGQRREEGKEEVLLLLSQGGCGRRCTVSRSSEREFNLLLPKVGCSQYTMY